MSDNRIYNQINSLKIEVVMTEFSFQNQTEQLKSHFSFLIHFAIFSSAFDNIWQLLTKLDLIHELFLHVIFLSAHLFYLSILSIFLFCLMIDKKTSSVLGTASCDQITRGNMMSCRWWSLCMVSQTNRVPLSEWPMVRLHMLSLFLSYTLMDHMLLNRA